MLVDKIKCQKYNSVIHYEWIFFILIISYFFIFFLNLYTDSYLPMTDFFNLCLNKEIKKEMDYKDKIGYLREIFSSTLTYSITNNNKNKEWGFN